MSGWRETMEEHQRFLDTVLALIQKRLEKLTRQITEGEKEVEAMHEYYWENYTAKSELTKNYPSHSPIDYTAYIDHLA